MKSTLTRSLIVLLVLSALIGCGKLPDEHLIAKGGGYEEEGKFTEAIASYEKLAERYPQSPLRPEALYKAGLVYTNGLQEFDRGISMLERVIAEHPEAKEAAQCQFMIGFIFANNAADTAQARIAYQKFVETYPDHELIPSVEWELRYLGKDINEIPELQHLEGSE